MSTRVIPGISFEVSYEIVPQQLFPAGVVAMIGTASRGPICVPTDATSYRELVEIFGHEVQGYSLLKNAKQAFQNGVFQVVATRVGGSTATPASTVLKGSKKKIDVLKISAKEGGELGNDIKVIVLKGSSPDTVRIEITDGVNLPEAFDNLVMNKSSDLYLEKIMNENSRIVTVQSLIDEPSPDLHNPVPTEAVLSGRTALPPTIKDYENALEVLEMEPNIDLVYACDEWNPEVHAIVDAHCINMSLGKEPKPLGPRMGMGTVAPNEPVDQIVKRIETLVSERFIIVAPYGCAGAVAGLVSKLNYYESPTFKTLTGIADIEKRYNTSEQMKLLTNGILPIDAVKGRGIIVVKGITTKLRQISVMRIGDRAIRGVKNIADNFIGLLNNDRKRMALKEKITEFLIGMQNDGAIVPSVDNKEPSFLVDVYSSQSDFAQGIVRVDVAVRPVRAMDYIYAKITVQA
jgi:Phage tail sheath protein subtilisin-like domain/Phage tail sheath C-terminal domain